MSIEEWLTLVLACALGIIGLFIAASDSGAIIYILGLELFIAAVAYVFIRIKRYFDRIDQTGH